MANPWYTKIKIFLIHIYILVADVTYILYNNKLYKYIIFFMAYLKKKVIFSM